VAHGEESVLIDCSGSYQVLEYLRSDDENFDRELPARFRRHPGFSG
ncbi:uncharacterized protein METZ01_LOCUS325196, partial [marine metagenome]